jgi:hypothetical protein
MAAAGRPPAEGGDDDLKRLLASLPEWVEAERCCCARGSNISSLDSEG